MPRSRKQKLDLPRKIMLRMTEDDVTNAICNSRKYCAIARTISRQMEVPIGRVRVSQAGASIAKGEYRDLQCGNFDAAGVWVEHGPPPRNCSDPLRAVFPGAISGLNLTITAVLVWAATLILLSRADRAAHLLDEATAGRALSADRLPVPPLTIENRATVQLALKFPRFTSI